MIGKAEAAQPMILDAHAVETHGAVSVSIHEVDLRLEFCG